MPANYAFCQKKTYIFLSPLILFTRRPYPGYPLIFFLETGSGCGLGGGEGVRCLEKVSLGQAEEVLRCGDEIGGHISIDMLQTERLLATLLFIYV